MPYLLATLYSLQSNRGGIGIIDSTRGLIYLQIDEEEKLIITPQLREIAFHDNHYFISTPATVRIYKLNINRHLPLLVHEKTISLPEWILGGKKQNDLLGIHVSPKRNRLLVANNLINAVEEFTIEGNFIRRHSLFDIAPESFKIPTSIDNNFNYGRIRHICESEDGSIFLTISSINSTEDGCVLNFDTGEVFLNDLNVPHAAIFYKNTFFIQEVKKGMLSAYKISTKGKVTQNKHWENIPTIFNSKYQDNIQHVKGMTCLHDTVYIGAYSVRSKINNEIPPRIVSFNTESGKQDQKEIFFPDLDYFRNPKIFSLNILPDSFSSHLLKETTIILDGMKTEAKLFSASRPPCSDKSDNLTNEVLSHSQNKVTGSHNHISSLTYNNISVELTNVWLSYRRSALSLFSFKKQLRKSREFIAIRDISFSLFEGETVGIIGRNGSGKSTLSMLISGSLVPDKGNLTTNGNVQLLSIGLGFRNELTGRENVLLNGALLGLTRRQINNCFDDILVFSELADFIDEPVRTYSSGMRSRLGFAVATAVSPDILILDEVLSTGDAAFKKKANERMMAMRNRTKTIIMISHSIGQIKKTCSRVIWMHQGRIVADGPPADITPVYDKFCKDPDMWKFLPNSADS